MHGFEYFVPTEIVFGAGSTEKLPELLKKRGLSRVLVVYGGSSAKKSGLLDRVFRLLDEAGVQYRALGGVQPNPRAALAREGVQLALESGADDYITKPFSPSELVARVKAHISRYERLVGSTALKNDVIEIRGLKIDKTDRRVYVDNEEKVFTNKEFDILCFLASNPNKVFSKDELFSKIWNMDSIGDIATVTVHIKKIREKIEFDTSNPQYIETVWGVGYRFRM